MLTHECKGNASYKHLSIKQENIDLYYKNKPRIFATVPNIPELTVPSGQEVTNKSLEGVWQSCLVQPGAHDFRIALLPVLKVISADKTFINIMTRGRDAKSNAIIFSQGEYRLPSDSVYVEILGKSSDPVFVPGTENEISVERLHDNLIKLSFSMPDKEKRWVEYWFRVPSPDVKIMAD